jgi:hypothetical protein
MALWLRNVRETPNGPWVVSKTLLLVGLLISIKRHKRYMAGMRSLDFVFGFLLATQNLRVGSWLGAVSLL